MHSNFFFDISPQCRVSLLLFSFAFGLFVLRIFCGYHTKYRKTGWEINITHTPCVAAVAFCLLSTLPPPNLPSSPHSDIANAVIHVLHNDAYYKYICVYIDTHICMYNRIYSTTGSQLHEWNARQTVKCDENIACSSMLFVNESESESDRHRMKASYEYISIKNIYTIHMYKKLDR